jgi:prophage DNA circulation protein
MANRKRNIRMEICFSAEEYDALIQKMALTGIKNQGAYIRKMAIEGYIVRFDTDEAQKLLQLISNATNNINQIAKHANITQNIYANDVQRLSEQVRQLKEDTQQAINIYKKARKFLDC